MNANNKNLGLISLMFEENSRREFEEYLLYIKKEEETIFNQILELFSYNNGKKLEPPEIVIYKNGNGEEIKDKKMPLIAYYNPFDKKIYIPEEFIELLQKYDKTIELIKQRLIGKIAEKLSDEKNLNNPNNIEEILGDLIRNNPDLNDLIRILMVLKPARMRDYITLIEILAHETTHAITDATTNLTKYIFTSNSINNVESTYFYEFLAGLVTQTIKNNYFKFLEDERKTEEKELEIKKTLEKIEKERDFLIEFLNSERKNPGQDNQEKFLEKRLKSSEIAQGWGTAISYFLTREENIQLIREIHNDLKEVKTEEDLGRIFNKWIYRTVNFLREKKNV